MRHLSTSDLHIIADDIIEALKPFVKECIDKAISDKDTVMTSNEVASLLGISRDAVRVRCIRGQLPFHKTNGHYWFSKNEITSFLLSERKLSSIHTVDDHL